MLLEYGFEPEVQARAAAEEFVDFCRGRMWVFSDVGTTGAGEPLYAFTHRTFMEYFTAAHLAYTSDTPEDLARVLAPHVAADEWEVVSELAVQIKDRTTRLGADRVYTALLAEDSCADRSMALQFLGRCLRSVTPTPGTVRRLTGEILDRLLTSGLNNYFPYSPLLVLVDNCTTCPDIVNDVIRGRSAKLIELADPAIRLEGLRLAVFLARVMLTPSNSQMAFWQARRAENIQTYADEIVAAAAYDGAMAKIAVDEGLLTLDQILEMPHGLLLELRDRPYGIFGIMWYGRIATLIAPEEDHRDCYATIGRHILARSDPPYVAGRVAPWNSYLDLKSAAVRPRQAYDSVAFLGAATCLLISSEALPALPDGEPEALLGALSDLHPYIARRLGVGSDDELPELPVPEKFQQLFRDWADNKVDFAGPEPEGQDSSEGVAV